jgi:hypothetical protein
MEIALGFCIMHNTHVQGFMMIDMTRLYVFNGAVRENTTFTLYSEGSLNETY